MRVVSRIMSRFRRQIPYVISAFIVLISYLLWYNFKSPPINSNMGFDLFPWRQVDLSFSPFNPLIWPGSYVPWAFGTPLQMYYGTLFSASGGSYSIGLFLSVLLIDIAGGLCLYYLVTKWLRGIGIRSEYALVGVLIYAFNDYKLLNGFGVTDGYTSNGILTPGDPALILILTFLTFLTLFRTRQYVLILGVFSFFAFSNFPNGSLLLVQEYLVALAVLLSYKWSSLRIRRLGRATLRIFKEGALILSAVVLANAYVLYPLLLTFRLYASDLSSPTPSFGISYSFDSNLTLFNSLRLATDWAIFTYKSPPWAVQYLVNPFAILLSLIVPILALSAGFWVRRLSDKLLYAMMLMAICFAATVNSPLGTWFATITFDVPPFRVFFYGAAFSTLVLIFYCFFAVPSIAFVVRILSDPSLWTSRRPLAVAGATANSRLRWSARARGIFLPSRILTGLLCVLLVASVYPLYSSSFSESHSSQYPLSSTLPPYYERASAFLQNLAPNAPAMVFPEVEPFDSNAINGSTWYAGINLFPDLIANPSISSAYPDNYVGEFGTSITPEGLVYDEGGTICPPPDCYRGSVSPIPLDSNIYANDSVQYVTNTPGTIDWQASFTTDNLSFSHDNGTSMDFKVNSSVPESNGHWAIGNFSSPRNLSEYSDAIVNFSLIGANAATVYFGFHSETAYGPGDGYALGDFTSLGSSANANSVLISLNSPSVRGGGNLANVTNLFFVDQSPPSHHTAYLNISSVRFVAVPAYVAPSWIAGTPNERVSLNSKPSGTSVTFEVNRSMVVPNGHWALGYLASATNFSGYRFAILNYTLSGVDPQYLSFGYHSGQEYSSGNAYQLSRYLTFNSSGSYESLIPLNAPTTLGGGSLTNATNVFLTYQPPYPQSGVGYINLSSMILAKGMNDYGLFLANDLARLGVEFAYVDTSIVYTNFPDYAGNYYNGIFSTSSYFTRIFHQGTVSIYRNHLYAGLFGSPAQIQLASSKQIQLGGLTSAFSAAYYNESNSGTGYVSGSINPQSWNLTSANITAVTQHSVTSYEAVVDARTDAVLEFRTQFNNSWLAQFTNGTTIPVHFEIDGYANAWLIPPGRYSLTITFRGAVGFAYAEAATLLIPLVMASAFLIIWFRRWRAPPVTVSPSISHPR
jgi:hypothetical protein